MLIFGAFQILLSQIPDFDRLWFLSIVAAVMSFSYSSIGLGLAIGKTTGQSSSYKQLTTSSCLALCCHEVPGQTFKQVAMSDIQDPAFTFDGWSCPSLLPSCHLATRLLVLDWLLARPQVSLFATLQNGHQIALLSLVFASLMVLNWSLARLQVMHSFIHLDPC